MLHECIEASTREVGKSGLAEPNVPGTMGPRCFVHSGNCRASNPQPVKSQMRSQIVRVSGKRGGNWVQTNQWRPARRSDRCARLLCSCTGKRVRNPQLLRKQSRIPPCCGRARRWSPGLHTEESGVRQELPGRERREKRGKKERRLFVSSSSAGSPFRQPKPRPQRSPSTPLGLGALSMSDTAHSVPTLVFSHAWPCVPLEPWALPVGRKAQSSRPCLELYPLHSSLNNPLYDMMCARLPFIERDYNIRIGIQAVH
jgi:hypothetical protein